MAGGHIERSSRAEQTGTTELQRDTLILALKKRGWTLKKIGQHPQVKMTAPGVHYALKRLTGKQRVQTHLVVCEGCWCDVQRGQLNRDGLCPECSADDAAEKPPATEEW
jgi:hypothetical protein